MVVVVVRADRSVLRHIIMNNNTIATTTTAHNIITNEATTIPAIKPVLEWGVSSFIYVPIVELGSEVLMLRMKRDLGHG